MTANRGRMITNCSRSVDLRARACRTIAQGSRAARASELDCCPYQRPCRNIVLRAIRSLRRAAWRAHACSINREEPQSWPATRDPAIADRCCDRRADHLRLLAVPAQERAHDQGPRKRARDSRRADLQSVCVWNTARAKHFFCSRCGVYTFHRKRAAPDHYGVNVFCLEDFDVGAFRVSRHRWRGNVGDRGNGAA